MRYERTLPFLFSLLLLLLPFFPSAQSGSAKKEKGYGEERIELRVVEYARDGTPIDGTIPDSLQGKYLFHNNGTIHKHFSVLEMALAHYKGYHPRPKANADQEIIYVSRLGDPKEQFGLDMEEGKSSYVLEYDMENGFSVVE